MSLFIFLAIAITIGTSIYIGVLAINPIGLALAATLPLGFAPLGFIIGAGILMASLGGLLGFVGIHRAIHERLKKDNYGRLYSFKDTL